MKKLWYLFAQAVTLLLAAYFVVHTLQPSWLSNWRWPSSQASVEKPTIPVVTNNALTAPVSEGSFRFAAQKAAPAVVSIKTSKTSKVDPNADPWMKFFFGERDENQQGLGSGVIVSADGYILTNNHVIEGADEMIVSLNDRRTAKAKIIGTDPETDLALLKIDLANVPVINLGDSDKLQVGDQVLAIGNPFGVGQTVTSGIVSALGRSHLGINTFENFIQTDAAINPGNSGGALVDLGGNLLGINTAIYSRSGGSMGIGFAIPTSIAQQVMQSLKTNGQVTRGYIGVEPQELTPELADSFGINGAKGVIITGVSQNGPAAQAGLKPGDIITAVNGKPVSSVPELLNAVAELPPGKAYPFKIQRATKPLDLSITPRPRPQRRLNEQKER